MQISIYVTTGASSSSPQSSKVVGRTVVVRTVVVEVSLVVVSVVGGLVVVPVVVVRLVVPIVVVGLVVPVVVVRLVVPVVVVRLVVPVVVVRVVVSSGASDVPIVGSGSGVSSWPIVCPDTSRSKSPANKMLTRAILICRNSDLWVLVFDCDCECDELANGLSFALTLSFYSEAAGAHTIALSQNADIRRNTSIRT
jgi:hypothetical protein